jgi:alpha-beta hydrolase superfamily lysophospholipase
LSSVNAPRPAPARDYAEARRRFDGLRARDGAEIGSPGRSRFYSHGRRTPLAAVFVHGFTNCPQQWDMFAGELHAAGHSIVVPRLPGHGHADRDARALVRHGADELLACVGEAVDIACGAGDRVVLAGLSIGGAMATWLALERDDIAHAIAIVPFFAPSRLDVARSSVLTRTLEAVPNFFVPWDPGGDGSAIPAYGYPRFSSRMLAECLRIGLAVERESRERAPHGRTSFLLNAREPAVNNDVALLIRQRFEGHRSQSTGVVVLDDLPANHDIIDPTNPEARVRSVYPELRALVEAAT